MGSWNHTCALTNLPIFSGEKVYVMFLQESMSEIESECYPNKYWCLTPYMFTGTYDDYGSVEDCGGVLLDYVISSIKENLIELELGKNPCHAIAVKRENFDVDLLFNADREGRLFVKANPHMQVLCDNKSNLRLKHIVFRKSALESFLEKFSIDGYQVKINRDYYRNKFLELGLNGSIKAAFSPMSGRYFQDTTEMGYSLAATDLYYFMDVFNDYIGKYELDNSTTPNPEELKRFEAFVDSLSIIYALRTYKGYARELWSPVGGAGSQNGETDMQVMKAKLIIAEAKKINKRWDD